MMRSVATITAIVLCSSCSNNQSAPEVDYISFQCKIVEVCTNLDSGVTDCRAATGEQVFEFLYDSGSPASLIFGENSINFDYHGHMHTPQLIVIEGAENAVAGEPSIPLPAGTEFYENTDGQSFKFLSGWSDGRPDTIESLLLQEGARLTSSAHCTCPRGIPC